MKNSLKNIKVAIFDFDDIEENIINFSKVGIKALLPDDVDLLI